MMLYIDPGTGSMMFAIIISIVGFVTYIARVFWVKLKFVITRGRVQKLDSKRIPLLIFAEAKRYWMVFLPIIRELDKREIDIEYWTTSQDDPALTQKDYKHLKAKFIGEGNKAFTKLNMVTADVLVASTPGLGVYQWKRSKFVECYIHVQHGANDIAGYRMFGTDFYDCSLLSGQYQVDETRELEKKRYLPPKEVELVGIPYMDDMRSKIESTERIEHDRTCVLLAPSWGPNSIFNKYGSRVLDELIKTGYYVIVRPHPQTLISDSEMIQEIIDNYPDTNTLRWDRSSNNFDSLHEADILISDFSGIIFDFTLAFNKPVIYANTEFKTDCYDYYWLDKAPWTLRILPHLGVELNDDNVSDVKNLIDSCINDPRFKAGRDKARAETWVHMGEGAVRTADFIEKKLNSFTKKG